MIKVKISIIISNLKLNIANFKINLNIMKRFLILTINNKYAKNMLILYLLFKVSANSIDIFRYFFYQKIEILNNNNKNNKKKSNLKIIIG